MSRVHAWFVVPSLIVAGVLFPAGGRVAVAGDADPTVFQQAIRSWMGVVALLAEDGGEMEAEERREEANRDHRGHRNGRHRDHDHGERREHEPRMSPGMPGGHGPHGMPMPGMRRDPQAMLGEIVGRLSRIERKLDAGPGMGNPWSPRPQGGRDRGGRPPMRVEQAREKMEQARQKFREMEERIEKLEAEVERLKAGR